MSEFVERRFYVPSPFSLRLLEAAEPAFKSRRYRVLMAPSSSGKGWTLDQAEKARRSKNHLGQTKFDFLMVPPITERRWAHNEIVRVLVARLGVTPKTGSHPVEWLAGRFHQAGARGIAFDDANKMPAAGVEAIHQLREEFIRFGHPIGIVFASAALHTETPLFEHFYGSSHNSEFDQRQNRLVRKEPFYRIPNHTIDELPHLLRAYEDVYRPQFPKLELEPYFESIYEWLCHPHFDQDGLGEVRMGALDDLILAGLDEAALRDLPDLGSDLEVLRDTAELLSLGGASRRTSRRDSRG